VPTGHQRLVVVEPEAVSDLVNQRLGGLLQVGGGCQEKGRATR
jgi:hypothetical protein